MFKSLSSLALTAVGAACTVAGTAGRIIKRPGVIKALGGAVVLTAATAASAQTPAIDPIVFPFDLTELAEVILEAGVEGFKAWLPVIIVLTLLFKLVFRSRKAV